MGSKDKRKRRKCKGRDGARAKEGSYPYQPGSILKIEFRPETESLGDGACLHEGKESGHQESAGFIQLTIVKTFSRTLSCVLLVRVDLGGMDDKSREAFTANRGCCGTRKEINVVLKLYDRRFSDGIREDYGAAQWTPGIEEDWRRFEALDEQDKPEVCAEGENDSWLYRSSGEEEEARGTKERGEREFKVERPDQEKKPLSGRKSRTKGGSLAKVTDSGRQCGQASSAQQKISPSKWTAGHREAYMQKVCDRSFRTEHTIYQHLKAVQGRSVPFVYGTVRLPIGRNRGMDGGQVNGIVMEYIHPSFTLRDIPENVSDKSRWQELGEMAVRLVQDLGDCGVLNEDVRLDNNLIVPVKEGYYDYEDRGDEEEEPDNVSEDSRKLRFFRAVMIDFGLARLQREDEGEEDWKKARYFRDEEGAVGYVLENFLGTAAGSEWEARPFKFRHSHRLEPQEYDDCL